MAFYDWNRDGKRDMQDDFIEYHIYKECTDESNYTPRKISRTRPSDTLEKNTSTSSSEEKMIIGIIAGLIIFLLFVSFLMENAEPKHTYSNGYTRSSSYSYTSSYKTNIRESSTNNSVSTKKSTSNKSTYNSNTNDDPYDEWGE